MRDIHVWDSVVLSRREWTAGDGREYAELEIACPAYTSQPGQFVMIRGSDRDLNWAYPYVIQRHTERSFSVLAGRRTRLYAHPAGAELAFWGPVGKGLSFDGDFTVVAQNASYPMVLPLLRAYPDRCKKLLLVDTGEGRACGPFAGEGVEQELVGADEVLAEVERAGTQNLILALDLPLLERVMADAQPQLKRRARVFAATKMACGIGACKGCNLHDRDNPVGLSVCCEGPYIPYEKIDFEADRNCFLAF